mmetsp:Transcript_15073/g.22675  ORF Transcript_15073/g.22675 Transcript_15073/m.22675 type:complete len:216 (-) Transcript_15073:132-779(-)
MDIPVSESTANNERSHQSDRSREGSCPSTASRPAGPDNPDADDSRFVCNICLDPVRDSIVTVCGHLYCWPCLYRWLNIGHTTCPVCKAGVSRENVIPLYIRGSEEDPRLKSTPEVPNRPHAQRPAPGPSVPPQGGPIPPGAMAGQFGGIQFFAGFGFFPSLFGLQFQNFAPPPPHAQRQHQQAGRALTQEEIQQNFISRFLVMLGTFVIICLILF